MTPEAGVPPMQRGLESEVLGVENLVMTLLVRLSQRDGEHELLVSAEQTPQEELTRFLDRHGPYARVWIRLASGEYVRYDHIVSIRIQG
jgi:hypothetical protein